MDARPHQNVPAYGIRFAIASGMNETFETTLLASMRDYRGHAVSYCERPTLILSEIVRGLKGVAAGRRFEGRIEQRWLHPECINQTLERLSARIVRPLDAPV